MGSCASKPKAVASNKSDQSMADKSGQSNKVDNGYVCT